VLDGNEVMTLIRGERLTPLQVAAHGGGTQEVIKPEPGLKVPPLVEGERPQPA
jgi:hypothetical protein